MCTLLQKYSLKVEHTCTPLSHVTPPPSLPHLVNKVHPEGKAGKGDDVPQASENVQVPSRMWQAVKVNRRSINMHSYPLHQIPAVSERNYN